MGFKKDFKQLVNDSKDVKINQALIRADQALMKTDLQHHIKRTDLLEAKLDSVWHRGALGLAFLGGFFGAVKHLLALFS